MKKVYVCRSQLCSISAGLGYIDRGRFISFTTKKQTTKFSSANCQKNVKSKLYHIENSSLVVKS